MVQARDDCRVQSVGLFARRPRRVVHGWSPTTLRSLESRIEKIARLLLHPRVGRGALLMRSSHRVNENGLKPISAVPDTLLLDQQVRRQRNMHFVVVVEDDIILLSQRVSTAH